MRWRQFLYNFLPEPGHVPWRERGLSGFGALLAIVAVVLLSPALLPAPFYVIAAVGASSVLIFALPASPLAQPWSVFGGYVVSAAIGVTMARWVPYEPVAAGLAVGGAIVAMLTLRCLHAPAGAVALFAVIGGDTIRDLGFAYVLTPVAANAALLVALGILYHNLIPGRHYPRPHPELVAREPEVVAAPTLSGLSHEELGAILDEYGHPLEISGEELDEILAIVERRRRQSRARRR
ncbi:MAG: HPP family protein [Rhodocyclales bacterium]|nr:HPP family protein [Rhodocyclales bacterium]